MRSDNKRRKRNIQQTQKIARRAPQRDEEPAPPALEGSQGSQPNGTRREGSDLPLPRGESRDEGAPKKRGRGRPRLTPEGRAARKRLNALTHGIRSNIPVVPGMEDEQEYIQHRDGIIESLAPVGYFEKLLTEQIAIIFWKMRRTLRYEIASTMLQIEQRASELMIADAYAARTLAKGEFRDPDPDVLEEQWETRMLLPPEEADRLSKEHRSLHRQWVATLHELQALQAHRLGKALLPIRMSVS